MTEIDLSIGKKVVVTIEKIVFSGEGLARHNGFSVFVPMSVPEDEVEIEIISMKKTYARGIIINILKPSKWRVSTEKISFEDYDGCNFAMMTYDRQLEEKEKMLYEVFKQIGKIDINESEIERDSIIPSDLIKNYRNKTAEPIFKIDGEIKTGFYSPKSHNVFSTENNILRSDVATNIINQFLLKVNAISTKKGFKVFNEREKTGFLRHVVIRNNEKGDVMLVIVVNKRSQYNKLATLLEELCDENESIKSVYISVKENDNNVILGDFNEKIVGADYIEEEINGIKFKIYPNSFFQINKGQAEKLYDKAISYIKEGAIETVVDAFSGTGTIAMLISKIAKKVFAVESVESSVIAGRQTIDENGITNVEMIHGKVEKALPNILQKEKVDAIMFDPPRRGLDEKTIRSVVKNGIKNIVYVSCNPATQARDVKYFCENGYKLKKICPVDLFPQTAHIETVVLLTKFSTFS